MEILPEIIGILGSGFCGNIELFPDSPECVAHLFFTVRVGAGRIEEIHAAVIGLAEQIRGVFFGNPLDGKRAESVFIDSDAGFAEGYSNHKSVPPCM